MLGDLSAKYESNGNPASISDGMFDSGGKSYGMYQLASNDGSVHSYLGWLKRNGYWFANQLLEHPIGSDQFDDSWTFLGKGENKEDFAKAQHEYIKYAYYDPTIEALKANGYDIEKHHEVMKDVVWSRAVQYGAGNVVEMFTKACNSLGHPNLSYVDDKWFDKAMIKAIYLDVCSSDEWTDGSPNLRYGLYSRFKRECEDALAKI
jgi:hypothetical protein